MKGKPNKPKPSGLEYVPDSFDYVTAKQAIENCQKAWRNFGISLWDAVKKLPRKIK